MPSKTVSYECNICKCRFTEWEEAVECEKGHRKPVDVTAERYKKSPLKEERKCPEVVFVKFDDGSGRYYKKI